MNNFNKRNNKNLVPSDFSFKFAAVGFILIWIIGILSSFAITALIIGVLWKIFTQM